MLNESSLFNDRDRYIQNKLTKVENSSVGRFNFITNNSMCRYIVILIPF